MQSLVIPRVTTPRHKYPPGGFAFPYQLFPKSPIKGGDRGYAGPSCLPVRDEGVGGKPLSATNEPGHHLALASRIVRKRDFYAGGFMILFGLVMALKGPTYNLGTLMHMGPGFLPTALGVVLIGIGIAIAMTAVAVPGDEDEDILPADPQWFAWACILLSPIAFIVFGSLGGLAPATFMCVFVAALGDKKATWLGCFVLSAIICVFGVLLFHFVLQIPMPVLKFMGWSML